MIALVSLHIQYFQYSYVHQTTFKLQVYVTDFILYFLLVSVYTGSN